MCDTAEIDTPEKFLCPISMVVMSNPVRTETGHVFERSAILEWIYFGKPNCPLSRQPLHPSRFTRDTELEEEIRQWRLENGIPDVDPAAETDENEEEEDLFPRTPAQENAAKNAEATRLLTLREKVLRNQHIRTSTYLKRQQSAIAA